VRCPIRANLALLLSEGDLSADEAGAYAGRWLLAREDEIDLAMTSLGGRAWPAYEACYPEGLAAVTRFAGGSRERFGRLLGEQLTASDLNA